MRAFILTVFWLFLVGLMSRFTLFVMGVEVTEHNDLATIVSMLINGMIVTWAGFLLWKPKHKEFA